MKFTIEQRELVEPLQKLAATVPPETSPGGTTQAIDQLSAMVDILIEPAKTGVTFTATDNTLRITFEVPVEGDDLTSCTVPAATLLHICSRFPDDAKIDFELMGKGYEIKFKSGRSHYTLIGHDPDSFPSIDNRKSEQDVIIPEGALFNLLSCTSYAMAKNDMRYYLLGVLLDVEPDKITAVATDGHRMAVIEHAQKTGVGKKDEVKAIIPAKSVAELLKILNPEGPDLTMHIAGNNLWLELADGRCKFQTMLVDGKYPDYKAVIPAERDLQAEINREEMILASERLIPVSDPMSVGATLVFKEGGDLVLSATNNKGDSGEEALALKVSWRAGAKKPPDDTVKIAINIQYLEEAIRSLDGDRAVLGVNDGSTSMLVVSPDGTHGKHIIMPMKA